MDDQVGELVQALRARAERVQGVVRPAALNFGHAPRFADAVYRRESDLVLLSVFAGGLAQRLGGLLDVEDVVHNLKSQADVLPIAGERFVLERLGAGAEAIGRSPATDA